MSAKFSKDPACVIVKRSVELDIPIGEKQPSYGNQSNQYYLEMIENKSRVLPECIPHSYDKIGQSLDMINERQSMKRSLEEDDDDDPTISKMGRYEKSDDPHENRINELNLDEATNDGYCNDEDKSEMYDDRENVNFFDKNPDIDTNNTTTNTNNEKPFEYPPSLGEMTAQINDRKNQIDDEKRIMVAKFKLLERMYPKIEIPHVTMDTDLKYMENRYCEILRSMKLDEKHQTYRKFLIIGFFAVEKILGKFFKLDMAGFANTQMRSMEQYDRLLIELGHKHYIPDAPEKFSVEVRLLGVFLIQTVIFIVIQKMSKKESPMAEAATSIAGMFMGGGGDNLSGLLGAFMGNGGGMNSRPEARPDFNPKPNSNPRPNTSRMCGPK